MKRVLTSSSSAIPAISALDAAATGTATGTATAAATTDRRDPIFEVHDAHREPERRDPIFEVHDAHREVELQIGGEPPGGGPRGAARGGVNGPALPGQRGRERPLSINPRLVISLAAVYVIWSSTYLAVRFAIAELPPLLMAGGRYSIAGLVMLAIARRRGAAWPSAAQWLRVVPIGALLFLCGNGFVVIAELSVSSGGAAVVCATMPLWTGVWAALGGERSSWRDWLSLAIGFVGVLVLMGGPSLQGRPLHLALIVLSPMCWALGSVLARRQSREWRIGASLASAMQMLTGGATLIAAGLVDGERLPAHAGAGSWLAVGYLLVFGSLIGFTAYNWLLRNARPVVATSYAYVNPIVAVLLGAAISGEPLGVTTLVANVLIVGAIALALIPRTART
jgi:drug/metabolite transporter (DMT)-like permease